jgi:hypothetical protein
MGNEESKAYVRNEKEAARPLFFYMVRNHVFVASE